MNFVQQTFQSQRHTPTPPPLPNVRVRALTPSFCVDGKIVAVGDVVTQGLHEATVLEFRRKAEIVRGNNV